MQDLAATESSLSMGKRDDPFTYVAKYVSKQGGDLHLGGTLGDVNFSEFRKSFQRNGGRDVALSANVQWQLFHMNYKRRKR